MADRHNWSKGRRGKGSVLDNGDIHTWNVDHMYGSPHHSEYWQDLNTSHRPVFQFDIDPAGGLFGDPHWGYSNETGKPDDHMLGVLMASNEQLHQAQPEESWDLDPNGPDDKGPHGPDYNFVLSSEEEDYAAMLKQWLDGINAPAAPPLSVHHQGPQDIMPQATVSPSQATALYPPGNEPDWAKKRSRRFWRRKHQ